jgi:hypothetical protein
MHIDDYASRPSAPTIDAGDFAQIKLAQASKRKAQPSP